MIGKENADDLDKSVSAQRFELKTMHPPGGEQRVRNEIEGALRIG